MSTHAVTTTLRLRINGQAIEVAPGTTVAAALALVPGGRGRRSVTGLARQAFCGMGVCGECRVTLNGHPHQLACMTLCAMGMEVTGD